MLFNSLSFAVFLPIVFFLYWFGTRRSTKGQNILLLLASYYFYGCWDWRFLFLLAFSTFLDYYTGLKIYDADSKGRKKLWLYISVLTNLGFLGFFKYYNFFTQSFVDVLSLVGFKADFATLNIILPVGISFYTFHGLSYVYDIYRGRIEPSRNVVNYSLFVSFFPLLVAGPIERATHLLPQVERPRTFSYSQSVDGLRQILWGLFKKIVVADNCASIADDIFANSSSYPASSLVLGGIFFAFQIYGDFSGYSDIALGTARLFGFELLRNFAYPYFSRDIAEFWRRWHISLSSWFKDYVYIPLGGSRGGRWKSVRNTMIIFAVSGFWHGANWTFIVWGLYHGLLFLPLLLLNQNKKNTDIVAQNSFLPSLREFFQIVVTFLLVVIGWIFFRADNLAHAVQYLSGMFSSSIIHTPVMEKPSDVIMSSFFIICLLIVEWVQRHRFHALRLENVRFRRIIRYAVYCSLIWAIIWFGGAQEQFIYFQF